MERKHKILRGLKAAENRAYIAMMEDPENPDKKAAWHKAAAAARKFHEGMRYGGR